jgi:hypothetical protein
VTRVRLTVPVEVEAPADVVWPAVTDWERREAEYGARA